MTAKAALGSLSQAHADSRYYRGTLISLAVLNGNRKWNLDSTVEERFGERVGGGGESGEGRGGRGAGRLRRLLTAISTVESTGQYTNR